jgi:hypothetical protein
MMTTTAKPKSDVNAATVSRFLKAAGMRRGDSMASGMVRGWHTYYAGFVVEQGKRYQAYETRLGGRMVTENWASVTWQQGDNARYWAEERRDEIERSEMAKAADILRAKGYTVEPNANGTVLIVKPGA